MPIPQHHSNSNSSSSPSSNSNPVPSVNVNSSSSSNSSSGTGPHSHPVPTSGSQSHYIPLTAVQSDPHPLPAGKRIAFGWPSASVGAAASGETLRLLPRRGAPESDRRAVETSAHPADGAVTAPATFFALRICTACDVREEKRIEARLAVSGEPLGVFDIRYAYVTQPFELPLSAAQYAAACREGVLLRMTSGELPYWLFGASIAQAETDSFSVGSADDPKSPIYDKHPNSAKSAAIGMSAESVPMTLRPHLVAVGAGAGGEAARQRLAEFYRQLRSVASVQPFGWLEGCVLDGLYQLDTARPGEGWRETLLSHLQLFFPQGDRLVIENHLSDISDGRFYSHESTLPLAIIARIWPDHPIVDQAIAFWQTNKHGMTTEGCYTMGYPLAVVAGLRGRTDLAELSVRILLERKEHLAAEWGVWQRQFLYRNWARACAWYSLGFTRSAIALREAGLVPHAVGTLEEEIRRFAQAMLDRQRPDGLWSCYLDEPETGADTSGSAGIAAALAVGARAGLLPDQAGVAAERAFAALQEHLTPDGLLGGSAQNNRGGEALQKSGYRTISQMAMGLMGQLTAALTPEQTERTKEH